MAHPPRPTQRDQFRIAVICALPCETNAMTLLFDHFWDEESQPYGRAPGDNNHYTTGRIGRHNVVLTTLPNMGTTSAAAASSNLRSSYRGLQLALLVGVCGGLPIISQQDAFLGDVVISKSIVQYDYGRQYPGRFVVRNTVEDSLGRANPDIRALLAFLDTEHGMKQLQMSSAAHLQQLQGKAGGQVAPGRRRPRANYACPDRSYDHLFKAAYTHKHRTGCDVCSSEANAACENASKASCTELSCDATNRVERQYLTEDTAFAPEIFIGRIGSGNAVMKSGKDRDRIAEEHDIIAFEMEGAGVWDQVPSIVVKGICDYADSHKNKEWQNFAAAAAASVARGILGQYVVNDEVGDPPRIDAESPKYPSTTPRLLPAPESRGGSRSFFNNNTGSNNWINLGDNY